jgi:hypothetical protein
LYKFCAVLHNHAPTPATAKQRQFPTQHPVTKEQKQMQGRGEALVMDPLRLLYRNIAATSTAISNLMSQVLLCNYM